MPSGRDSDCCIRLYWVKSSTLTMETVAGKPVLYFDGVPVRRTDALVSNEARVV